MAKPMFFKILLLSFFILPGFTVWSDGQSGKQPVPQAIPAGDTSKGYVIFYIPFNSMAPFYVYQIWDSKVKVGQNEYTTSLDYKKSLEILINNYGDPDSPGFGRERLTWAQYYKIDSTAPKLKMWRKDVGWYDFKGQLLDKKPFIKVACLPRKNKFVVSYDYGNRNNGEIPIDVDVRKGMFIPVELHVESRALNYTTSQITLRLNPDFPIPGEYFDFWNSDRLHRKKNRERFPVETTQNGLKLLVSGCRNSQQSARMSEMLEKAFNGLNLTKASDLEEFKERFRQEKNRNPDLRNIVLTCYQIGLKLAYF